jgi:hypothetical protein
MASKKKLISFCGIILDPNLITSVTKEYKYADATNAIRSGLLIYVDNHTVFVDINKFTGTPKTLDVMFAQFQILLERAVLDDKSSFFVGRQ